MADAAQIGRERRVKLVLLDRRELLGILNGLPAEFVCLAQSEQIPAGAVVTNIAYEPYRGCFLVEVWHESFAVVSDGDEAPLLRVTGEQVWRRKRLADEFEPL